MLQVSRRRFLTISSGGLLLGAVPALGQSTGAVPDTVDGLKRTMTEIYQAMRGGDQPKVEQMVRALALPGHEAWFRRVFGEEKGAAAAGEYSGVQGKFERDLVRLFVRVAAEGRSDIQVLRFEKAGSAEAVGRQNAALADMKNPIPLYSVRFVKPGEARGIHVYSFVYADGAFRLVGRMGALRQ
jgi:hypothetical protein